MDVCFKIVAFVGPWALLPIDRLAVLATYSSRDGRGCEGGKNSYSRGLKDGVGWNSSGLEWIRMVL